MKIDDLHSVNSLSRRLTLSSSKILLIVLMNESICKRTICHRMLIHTILLKV
jgi:DNA polymerase sigma